MVVEFDNVRKTINEKKIIKGISFKLDEKKVLALLGPNGAGKTTIIRLLMGVYKPDFGEIKLFGKDTKTTNYNELCRKIGVQNDGNVYEGLTVYDNLKLWGEIYGMEKKEIENSINELLDFFDLSEKKNKLASTLSKGMKQKVNLARAIIHNPKLLVLDEPNSGLDPKSSKELMDLLQKLIKKNNMSVIMCTHQLYGLDDIADYIGIIDKGSFVMYGNTRQLISYKWPLVEYMIEATPIESVKKVSSEFGKIYIEDKKVNIELSNSDIPKLIKKMVEENIEIYSVYRKKHNIKELYFSCIGEGESYEYDTN